MAYIARESVTSTSKMGDRSQLLSHTRCSCPVVVQTFLKQWQERLQAFLGVGKGVVGTIGGGKAKSTGGIEPRSAAISVAAEPRSIVRHMKDIFHCCNLN